ncbi:unnamed protein product [Peniophora sp. CBMAI 1063]|nr:unnamed protein product [Peniophora sp. CBMAI 1063]
MPPRAPSPAAQEATGRLRAEARARQRAGAGPLTDIVDPKALKTELARFYVQQQGQQEAPPGRIALNRAKRSLETISALAKGSDRISKSITRTLWALLLVEMKFARKHNAAASVQPMQRFLESATSEARRDNSWDIGKVRSLLARGWPEDQSVSKLKTSELGPLHWWLAARELKDKEPVRRQTIYDAAYRQIAAHTHSASTPSRSSGSRPPREAAGATNAALRGAIILDDDGGGNYAPDRPGSPDNPGDPGSPNEGREATPWRFGANAPAQFTVGAPTTVPPIPPPAPPPPGASRRAAPSPWLPPSGFTCDLKWNIADYNAHKALLLNWPRGLQAPDSAVWEHPHMHGLKVLADGLPLTNKKPCLNCSKRFYICIPRGSKACLPCYWEKGSQGKCEGYVPPDGPVEKPDYKLRKKFLQELDEAGVYPFPHHYVYEDGKAHHGAGSGGIGKPPGYPSPAPKYSPRRGGETSEAPADASSTAAGAGASDSVAAGASATSPTGGASSTSAPQPSNANRAPAANDTAVLADAPMDVDTDISAPPPTDPAPRTSRPSGVDVSAAEARAGASMAASFSQPRAPAQSMASVAEIPAGSPEGHNHEDATMVDVSNVPTGARKRRRQSPAGENMQPATPDGPVADAVAPHRKRQRREGASEAGKPPASGRRQAHADNAPPASASTPSPDDRHGAAEASARSSSRSQSSTAPPSELSPSAASPSRSSTATPMATPAPGATARHEGVAPAAAVIDKGKGRARARPRPTGEQQRQSAAAANRGIEFHSPVPGTRPAKRYGSPRFAARPWPVVPDADMQIQGDVAPLPSNGVSRINHPQGGPPPMSTLNLSGDIFLANHVERALCHEMRDVSNHHRDWILGRYEPEHVAPRHREIMQTLRELKDTVVAQRSMSHTGDGERHNQLADGTTLSLGTLSAPAGVRRDAQPMGSFGSATTSSAFATQPPSEPSSALSEAGLKAILANSLAPFHDMAGNVQDLTRRFAELEPITGRVNDMSARFDSMSDRVDVFGTDLRSLVARVKRLEDVGPLAQNLRAFAEQQDRLGEAPSPILVLRDGSTSVVPRLAQEAPGVSSSSNPPAQSQVDIRPPARPVSSAAASRASSKPRRSASQLPPPHGVSADPLPAAVAPIEVAAAVDQGIALQATADEATADEAMADKTPSPANGAERPPEMPTPLPPSLSVAVDPAAVQRPRTPESESPLTTNPSPGNLSVAPSHQDAGAGSSRAQSIAPHPSRDGTLVGEEGHSSDDDDVPMETGDDWAAGSRQRQAGDQGIPDSRPEPNKQAGNIISEDEDADGSSVDDESAPAPAMASPQKGRGGRGRGAGAPAKVPQPSDAAGGRRLRARQGRSA